jgi:hypothetical protein
MAAMAAMAAMAGSYRRGFSPAHVTNPAFSDGAMVACPPALTCAVVTWGSPLDDTVPVVSIASNADAFAVLHSDGHVSGWGSSANGSTAPSSVTSPASPVVSVASAYSAFVAIHSDGHVSAWGH